MNNIRKFLTALINGFIVLPTVLMLSAAIFLSYHLLLKPLFISVGVPLFYGLGNIIRTFQGKNIVKAPIGFGDWAMNALWLSALIITPLALAGVGIFAGSWAALHAAPWLANMTHGFMAMWYTKPFVVAFQAILGAVGFLGMIDGWPPVTRRGDEMEAYIPSEDGRYSWSDMGTDIKLYARKLFSLFNITQKFDIAKALPSRVRSDFSVPSLKGTWGFDPEKKMRVSESMAEWNYSLKTLFSRHEGYIGIPVSPSDPLQQPRMIPKPRS